MANPLDAVVNAYTYGVSEELEGWLKSLVGDEFNAKDFELESEHGDLVKDETGDGYYIINRYRLLKNKNVVGRKTIKIVVRIE